MLQDLVEDFRGFQPLAQARGHGLDGRVEDLRQPPYRATVEFEQVYLSPATRAEVKRDTYIAHIVFVLKDQVDNARIPINPLGLTITYFREDQAFVNDAGRAQ